MQFRISGKKAHRDNPHAPGALFQIEDLKEVGVTEVVLAINYQPEVMLCDGTTVAIKTRSTAPSQDFIQLVTTEDGYILSIQRLPYGSGTKASVLLQHGLMVDGAIWLLNSPEESFPFILADKGFDVWIANSRGTRHSLGHTYLSSDDSNYWNWSWDEMVAFDLPATVEYVYKHSGQKKIYFVGQSLGASIALAAISQQKLLNMIRTAALLAPIAYMDQVTSIIARGTAETYAAEAIYAMGYYQFNPNGIIVHNMLKGICSLAGADCLDLLTTFTGKNCCLNSSIIDLFLDKEPQSTSTKNIIHLCQMVRRGTVTKYDYGNNEDNIEFYSQPTPPAYNLSAVPNDFPIFFSYGGADKLSDVDDVSHLLDTFQSHDSDKLVIQNVDDYAHADFVMGMNARQVVYDPVMIFLDLH